MDGMFATLVVCLPSRHTGGTLVVEHDRQTKRIDFGGPDAEYKIQYAAFYTDCRHEIALFRHVNSNRKCSQLALEVRQPAPPAQPAAARAHGRGET